MFAGIISIGSLGSGDQRAFTVQAKVSSNSFASVVFTAKSSDHVQLDFPVSVWTGSGVTPQAIARAGETIRSLLSIATESGTYNVYQVGSLIFPSKPEGVTGQTELLQKIVQGYFVKNFLGTSSGRNLPSALSAFVNQISTLSSHIDSMRSTSSQAYSFSIPYLLSSLTYSTNLYQFLTWRLPLHQWTLGVRDDWGVPDLLAWAIQKFAGLNVSADDVIQLAYFLQSGAGASLVSYTSGIQGASQLLSSLASASIPDLGGLLQLISLTSQIANSLTSASNLVVSIISGAAQRIVSWIKQLQQQLYKIFQSLVNWISANIPLVNAAINKVVVWLYNALATVLNYVIGIFDTGPQAQSSAQSAHSGLSDMSASVNQWQGAWGQLSDRLQQVADEGRQRWNGFCDKFQPAVPMIQRITGWVGKGLWVATTLTGGASVSITGTSYGVVQGIGLIANTIDAGCTYSRSGSIPDLVTAISMASGATFLLGDLFPAEEHDLHAIGDILNAIGTGVSAVSSVQNSMSGSGFDVSSISRVVAAYDSANKQGTTYYTSATPDYVAAIGAIDSVSSLPGLDAVNVIMKDVQPCANVMAQFSSYQKDGMVAPDLQSQVGQCQQNGQGAISAIGNGDYSALSQAEALPHFASQVNDAVEARHAEFVAAKIALGQLTSALSLLRRCGVLWVQPNPTVLGQGQQALDQAQSQFSAGKYTDATNSVSQELVAKLHSADQSCRSSASQVWLEVGAAAAVFVVVVFSAFVHLRKTRRPQK